VAHFTGGADSPLYLFYIFHTILASMLLPPRQVYRIALLSILLFSSLFMLEYAKIIHHYHLSILLPELAHNLDAVLMIIAAMGSTLLFTAFMSELIMDRVRRQHHTLADLTARLDEHNRHLIEMEQAKSAFYRKVAHELKTPLASIQSLLRVILDTFPLPEDAKSMIGRAEQRADGTLKMVKDLLSLSRQTVSAFASNDRHQLDLVEVLNKIVADYTIEAQKKNIDLRLEASEKNLPFTASANGMDELFGNLIGNGLRYTPDGGKVIITARREQNKIIVEVSDTGIGIAPEDQQHLFEEFFRASNAKEFCQMGTGLGIAIVKSIVDRHHGQISVRSEIGKGSTFSVTLPS
jgi:signal transduction histidine kinase